MNANLLEPTSFSLLVRARASDEEAWRQIVHLYGPLVHRWCKRSGLDDNDLADVFQESFRAVSRNLHSFSPNKTVGAFRSWLRTIVRTKIADHFRRRAQQAVGQGGSAAQMHLNEMADPLHDGRFEESDADVASDHAIVVRQAMDLIRPQFTPQNWNAFWQVAVEGPQRRRGRPAARRERASGAAGQLPHSPAAARSARRAGRRRHAVAPAVAELAKSSEILRGASKFWRIPLRGMLTRTRACHTSKMVKISPLQLHA